MGENENYWFHLITFCLLCQLQKSGNYRHGFSFHFYMFHVVMNQGGKLLGGAKEEERREGKISQSAKLYGILRGSFSIWNFKKNTLLIGFETDYIRLYTLWVFLTAWEIIQSPNIPQELQIPEKYWWLFVSGSTYPVLGIEECKESTITVVIVFLLQRQRWKGVCVGDSYIMWANSVCYILIIRSFDNVF